jgi:hypothetical protein
MAVYHDAVLAMRGAGLTLSADFHLNVLNTIIALIERVQVNSST